MIDFPAFRARPPWLGPDLQTLRNFIRRPTFDLSAWPAQPLEFPVRDGSGDRLTGLLHAGAGAKPGRPLAMLIHGLTGSAESAYVRASAHNLLSQGHGVLRLNLRGAGESWRSCRMRYHAGRSDDLRDVVVALPPQYRSEGMVAIGYSLGANILLKLLGEEGRHSPFRAAVAVSAPISLAAASRRIMAGRNRLYHSYLLRQMKVEALRLNAALDQTLRAAVDQANSVYEFDDRVVAAANGFESAEDYYARNSAARFLSRIAVPTLIVHALDDPWIPSDDYVTADMSANRTLVPLLPAAGGHVGFHGIGALLPWHDRCAGQFFSSIAV